MNRNWLLFFLGGLLVLGSLTGALVTLDQRAAYVRGWEMATETLNLPERLPLTGVNVDLTQYEADVLDEQLAAIAAAGFTWVRQPFLWSDIEPQPSAYDWAAYDALVAAVDAHPSLQLVAVLDGTPGWARHTLAPEHLFAPPASVEQYAQFAGVVAARYADSIDYYQIWDEPNITEHWGNLDVRPAHYAAMLRGAYQAIHDADPGASVIMAALAPTVETGPTNINEVDYLRALYEQGARGYFDAAAGKPYGFDHPPGDRTVDPDVLNFSRIILLREELIRQGDGDKPLWGSNFGWNSLPTDWAGPPSIWGAVTPEQQAQYTRDAYARAAREWPWLSGLILQHWDPDAPADDPIQGFAVAPVIDDWLRLGALWESSGLISGLYPVRNAYTEYSDNWRFSELGVDAIIPGAETATVEDENRIRVTFYGTEIALPVRRDDYAAYLYVTVDGAPANALPTDRAGEAYLILTSPDRQPEYGLITLADDLPLGVHTVEIVHRPYHGDDRWPIGGYAVATAPDLASYRQALIAAGVVGVIGVLTVVYASFRLPWRRVRSPSSDWMKRAVEWVIALAASLLVLVGALLTWDDALHSLLRRDPPALVLTILTAGLASLSPIAIVTLAALVVLFVLIYNRPLMGLLLVVFWSAFYMSSLDLLVRLFATVEVYLALTLGAVALRLMVGWARHRKGDVPASSRPSGLLADRRISAIDGLAAAFALLAVISLAWSDFRSPALHQLRVVIVEPLLLYGLLRLLRLTRRDLLWLVDTLIFTGAAIAVVGLIMYFAGDGVVETENGARRLIGVYGSPNGMGLYLGRVFPFALSYALLVPNSSWRKIFGALAGAIMLLAILLSQSRGAILLGLPAGVAAMLIVWHGKRAFKPLLLTLGGIALALVPLSLVLPRLSDLLGNTAFFRTQLWYSSLNLIQERPLTGVGLDQFLYWYRSRYLLPEAWAEPNLSIPHNVLLNYWVNLGILGVLLAVALQVAFWRRLWRYRAGLGSRERVWLAVVLGLAGSMAGALAHGLVDVTYFSINLAFVFFLLLGIAHELPESAGTATANQIGG